MLYNEFLQKINQIKKGVMVKASWKSEKSINGNTYEKISKGVVRFVKYGNIKGVVVKGNGNGNSAIIPDILYQANNGNYLVQMAKTRIKAKCVYKINGVEVDKQTYETMVKPQRNDSPIFRVKLENLISLK